MVLSRFLETGAAREAFEKALQLDPKLAGAHVNLATILAQSSAWAAAEEDLDRAIRLEGESPLVARAYYLRGEIRREQNQLETARTDLEAAVRLRPGFAAAWSQLGLVRRLLQDETGALAAFERAVELDPKDSTAQFRLGSEYLRGGKPHLAAEHLTEAARMDPDSRAVLYNLQMALREDGRVAEARQVEARMAQLLAQRRKASEGTLEAARLNNQGVELEKAGNVQAALGKYEAALELDPEHPGFRVNLGLALCRLGRWDEGIAQIREVVRRDPDNAQAAKALYSALEQRPNKAPPGRE
jgi:tetratricopeptide (TPR) repeat protein